MAQDTLVSHLIIMNYVVTPLSLAGSLLMLIFCIRSRAKGLSNHLITTLAISDIIFTLTNLVNFFQYDEDSLLCQIEGNAKAFFFVLSLLIATAIAILHHRLGILNSDIKKSKFFIWTMIITLSISFLTKAGPLYSDKITVRKWRGFTCLQEYNDPSETLTTGEVLYLIFLCGVPALIGPVLTIVYYILIQQRAKRASSMLGAVIKINNTLFWLPAGMFIVLIPYFTMTLMKYWLDMHTPDWLHFTSFLTTRSIGFINSLTYGLQRKAYARSKRQMSDSVVGFGFHDLSDMTFHE